MNCPYCSARNIDSSLNFCPNCGHPFVRCKGCGKPILYRTAFCMECGDSLDPHMTMGLPEPPTQEEEARKKAEEELRKRKAIEEQERRKAEFEARKRREEQERIRREQERKKRIPIIIGAVAGVIILIAIIAIAAKALLGGSSKPVDSPSATTQHVTRDNSASGETAGESSSDIDEQCAKIRERYENQLKAYKNSSRLVQKSFDDGTLYYLDGELVEIDTNSSGSSYYFHDTYLYFSEISNNTEELYYNDADQLIRWIDSDGMKHDELEANQYEVYNTYQVQAYELYQNYRDGGSAEVSSAAETATAAPTTAAETTAAPTEAASSGSHVFPYTDNSSLELDRNLSLDAFEICNSVPGVSFAYPKYVFNQSQFEDDTAYFSYVNPSTGEEEASLLVTRTERSCSNKMSRCAELQKMYENICTSTYISMTTDKAGDGMARALVGGFLDSAKHKGIYAIAATDGTYEYTLEFCYPDDDPYNEHSKAGYVYDCVYRYCSFSGTSYRPRDYSTFLSGSMGTKK